MLEGSEFSIAYWIGFILFITTLVLIDRFLVSKNSTVLIHSVYGTAFWFVFAVIFMIFLIFISDNFVRNHSVDFFAAYIIELTLSIDNVFVFIMIFDRLKITTHKQHIILRIGIISAVIMRLLIILFAIELIQQFKWIFYVFGSILIFSALNMLRKKSHIEKIPSYQKYFVKCKKDKFFTRQKGKLVPTINLLALIMVEQADILFAVDSIPAIITVTQDTFIIFTSNVMAIAGLRALFFCLSHSANNYYYLKHGIIMILLFIGIKLLLIPSGIHIEKEISLGVIFVVMTTAVIASRIRKNNLNRMS
jgi:tellurite resistance protein TerC